MNRIPLSIALRAALACAVLLGAACARNAQTADPAAARAPEDPKQFVERVDAELRDLWTRAATAEWIKSTYITDDTEQNAAWASEAVMAYQSRAIKEANRYRDRQDLDPTTARLLHLLRLSTTLPAPSDPEKRKALAETASKLEGIYGKGRYCGPAGKGPCRDLQQLSRVLATSRNYDELLDAWVGWRTISPPMRPLYTQLVNLSNEGAREIGHQNLGELWRMGYDMTPAQFEAETDRLWEQVKPLYEELHCYVRARLQKTYGKERVPDGKPIPAHLLGNMWAQEWANIYPLVEPYKTTTSLDVSAEIKRKGWDAKKMVQVSEDFFVSLGMEKLPERFYERSMLVKPRDRDVVCHASAWDVTYSGDYRIKMCIEPTEEDLITIHHELGHIYYYVYYHQLPVLFQTGANDGFHEAIGDALTLSITPQYLKQLGLLKTLPDDKQGLVNVQLKDALEKVAFLPFGKLIDQWRWDVFSGKTPPEQYNASWWQLRERYQGVSAPSPRTEEHFDPGAKYHIPANVPYTRYFLARILQFQFHRALCQIAGHQGPLHTCSIYGNKAAGEKLVAMLKLGASRPWPDALEAMTGQREMDATALLDYFAPLRAFLQEQNKGLSCGW
jgi:peptidyl-dipeptidase A